MRRLFCFVFCSMFVALSTTALSTTYFRRKKRMTINSDYLTLFSLISPTPLISLQKCYSGNHSQSAFASSTGIHICTLHGFNQILSSTQDTNKYKSFISSKIRSYSNLPSPLILKYGSLELRLFFFI